MKITIEGTIGETILFMQEMLKSETFWSADKEVKAVTEKTEAPKSPEGGQEKPKKKPEKKQDPPKKEWNEKQKADIQSIKEAHKEARAKKMDWNATEKARKANKRNAGTHGLRPDIKTEDIIRMRDKEKMSWNQIGEKLNCSPQTATNRYNKVKGK